MNKNIDDEFNIEDDLSMLFLSNKEEEEEFILEDDEMLPEKHDVSDTNKNKLIGKHSLRYDSIFRGKKNKNDDNIENEFEGEYYIESVEFDPTSTFIEQTIDNTDSARLSLLKVKVLDAVQQVGINTKNHRRKPSNSDFNKNYQKVLTILRPYGFTPVEIFVEYADYFSDNLFNMFTMLDSDVGAALIKELKEKKNLSFLDSIDFE